MSDAVLYVQDLERKMDLTTHFENQIEVRSNPDEQSSVTIYRGTINLYSQTVDRFLGIVALRRTDRIIEKQSKKQIISWIPFRTEVKQIPVTIHKEIWAYSSNEWVLIDGKKTESYGASLIDLARRQGVILTPTLIESVFGPIDERLVKLHQHNFWKKLE
jgi:hypothetical protein